MVTATDLRENARGRYLGILKKTKGHQLIVKISWLAVAEITGYHSSVGDYGVE